MGEFFGGLFGSQITQWVIGFVVTGISGWGFKLYRDKTGVAVEQAYAQMFQQAVTNAAGVLVNKISTGTLSGSAVVEIALELARKLIIDNPDSVSGVGINKIEREEDRQRKVADKIMDKAAGLSVAAPDVTVKIPKAGETPTPIAQPPVIGVPYGGVNIPGEPHRR